MEIMTIGCIAKQASVLFCNQFDKPACIEIRQGMRHVFQIEVAAVLRILISTN